MKYENIYPTYDCESIKYNYYGNYQHPNLLPLTASQHFNSAENTRCQVDELSQRQQTCITNYTNVPLIQ